MYTSSIGGSCLYIYIYIWEASGGSSHIDSRGIFVYLRHGYIYIYIYIYAAPNVYDASFIFMN